jgi:hypothetical protein
MNQAPQLLVHWSSPWQEFLGALGPALRRSPPKLRLEARAGLFPVRGMALSLLLEVLALATAIAHPAQVMETPIPQPVHRTPEVIYFSADELPQTEDLGGAAAGMYGARGGASEPHPSQVIRVARDVVLREKVTDAPQLNLPKSDSEISNLLAYRTEIPAAPRPAQIARRALPDVPTLETSSGRRPMTEFAVAAVPPPPEVERVRSRSETRYALETPAVPPPPAQLPESEISMRAPLPSVPVVPPPVAAPVEARSRAGQLLLPAATVAPPRPDVNVPFQSRGVLSGAAPTVVPPPVRLDETRHQLHSLGNAVVAPPPPDLPSPAAQSIHVHDLGVVPVQAPDPGSGAAASTGNSGVVVSPKPGHQAALPTVQEKATLAMSPAGSAKTGAEGEGGGHGISRGNGPGTSSSGTATGGTSAGAGKNTMVIAANTNSPYPGPGGAGIMNSGNPRAPGISVSGGKNIITLPSFGSTPEPSAMERAATPKSLGNGITVIAGPRAGGALNLYGVLKGDRVYTIYINTKIGTAVMQFADPSSVGHPSANQLTAPRALRAEAPVDRLAGKHGKLLIACDLDRNGMLKNARILKSDDSVAAKHMLEALSGWKFAPAFRGKEPVEVTAILGFGVDTN